MIDITVLTEQVTQPTPDEVNSLRESDWYVSLKDDIGSDVTETEFDVNIRLIEMYHRLGKRITDSTDKFKHANIYGKHIAEIIGQDINRHPSVVRRAVQFYNKEPDLQKFLQDKPKNLSWYKVRTQYLPDTKRSDTQNKTTVLESNGVQQPIQNEAPNVVQDIDIETASLSLQDLLDLFLQVIDAIPLVSRYIVPKQFGILLKDKYSADYINIIISKYSNNKSKEKVVFLKELELEALPTLIAGTPSLFENGQPQINSQSATNSSLVGKEKPITSLVFHYKLLYRKKFNQEPSINDASWAKWTTRLKSKLSQGHKIEDIISLLYLFANSKDSEKLSFDPGVLLSDFVFNKMVQVKNKGNSAALGDKYGKF